MVNELVPPGFLFRYALPVKRFDNIPRSRSPFLEWLPNCDVPWLSELNGEEFPVRLGLAWNPQGLLVAVNVTGRTMVPYFDSQSVFASSRIHYWIDTRGTQNVHRASRFCHHFVAFPGSDDNTIRQLPVARAKEDAPDADLEDLTSVVEVTDTAYSVFIWFDKETLHGFDPAAQSRLGFHVQIADDELGHFHLTHNGDFPVEADPSLWTALDLQDVEKPFQNP